jgi:anti-sigma factor RsiW
MDHGNAQELLHDLRRGRLDPARAAEVRDHLAGCLECRREDEAERALDDALRERLPRPAVPVALRRRIGLLAGSAADGEPGPAPSRRALPRRLRRWAPAAAVAAVALLAAGLAWEREARLRVGALERLGDEVVTDHLRALASAHPTDVESSDKHQVKPWFEGHLDFAPAVPPDGGELRLLGGAVGYVLDRKAAVISYALRRHRVTLLAFPTAGLDWPAPDREVGGVPARLWERRGFRAVLWRAGELGYALVSDADDLVPLAARLAPQTRLAGAPAP